MRGNFYIVKSVAKVLVTITLLTAVGCKKKLNTQQQTQEIDSLLKCADDYVDVNFYKSNYYAKKTAAQSEKINDSRRKALSYYYLAKNYSFLRKFLTCHAYIKKGFNEKATHSDALLYALFTSLNAGYYSRVGLLQKESQENFKLLKLLKGKNDLYSRLLFANTLMSVADNYTEKSNFKLAHQFAGRSLDLVEKIPEKEYMNARKIFKRKTYLYYYTGVIYLQERKPDEAIHYIEKAYRQAIKEKIKYISLPLECYGEYFMQKKNYHKAIIYFKKSIEVKHQFNQRTFSADSKIAEAYSKIGEIDSADFYLSRSENQRMLDLKSNNLDSSNAEHFVDEESREIVQRDNIRHVIIVLIIITVLAVVILFLYNYLQKLKTKNSFQISEKETIIQEKEDEINSLHTKLNEAFEELTTLAKENSPYFWIRFQEVHPDYCRKMLLLNPSLRASELTLSAYIYLGFTSKEIASYTFKALKTIENNRYNFRKKINLSNDKDLLIFIREYVK